MDKNREDFIKKRIKDSKKNILEKSGIRERFEDIIANGSIKFSSEISLARVSVKYCFSKKYKSLKRNSKFDYTPALIEMTETSISLIYNRQIHDVQYEDKSIPWYFADEIRFEIIDGAINLVSQCIKRKEYKLVSDEYYTYTPLNNNLKELINYAFNHPITETHEFYEYPRIYINKPSIKDLLSIYFIK